MLKTAQAQRGMTTISLLMLLALIGFVLMFIVKLFPVYLENFKVAAALKNLIGDPRVQETTTDPEIKELVLKKLQIDDVDRFKSSDIKIERDGSMRRISIKYETRVHLFSNVDAIVFFDQNQVEIRLR